MKTFFYTSLLSLSLLLAPALSAAADVSPTSQSAAPLTRDDFSLLINDYAFTPGDPWDAQTAARAGDASNGAFAGARDVAGASVDYYRHTFPGYTLYSAKLKGPDQPPQLAQITLKAPGVQTARGVSVGDAESSVMAAYGAAGDDADPQWRVYRTAEMQVTFQLTAGKVSQITLTSGPDGRDSSPLAQPVPLTPPAEPGQIAPPQSTETTPPTADPYNGEMPSQEPATAGADAPAPESDASDASDDRAIALAHQAIRDGNLTTLSDECLSYDIQDNAADSFVIVTVRENNSNTHCGGDPATAARLFNFKIARESDTILTDAGAADGDWHSVSP